jgi:hypothetical protein
MLMLAVFCTGGVAFAEEAVKVYPLPGVFLSDKATQEDAFMKALSSDDSRGNRQYAISRFNEAFRKAFPGCAEKIDSQNKYSTFVAYLQIPRVSRYKVRKSDTLVDLYLPMTMSINFANMITGESLYSYTYTYYAKYETTNDMLGNDQTVIQLYKETYRDLLDKVIAQAKENFKPFAIDATVKKEWNGVYLLDKGVRHGVAKGDTLADSRGLPLTVLYSADGYSVAQPLMGVPAIGSILGKFSNDPSMDDIRKPKVMLLSGDGDSSILAVPEQMIYQLFINALGKKSTFSLISIDKSFYDVQGAVIGETGIGQKVTQERELPEYFLRLRFFGPVYANLPSNKAHVTYDEYSIRSCGDLLDQSGRVLYGKCVDEKIIDEISGGVRFPREAREEIVVKNSLVTLADEFIKNVRFKRYELPVEPSGGKFLISDKASILQPDSNATAFRNVGRIGGIDGDVRIPTWQMTVRSRDEHTATASADLPLTREKTPPGKGDVVLVEGMIRGSRDSLKRVSICEKVGESGANANDERMRTSLYYSVAEGLAYPLYDSAMLHRATNLMGKGYFKLLRAAASADSARPQYCIEPVYKASCEPTAAGEIGIANKCTLLAGIKVFEKGEVVWKKGLQQSVTIATPKEAEPDYLNYKISRIVCGLMTDLAKRVDLKTVR